MLALPMSPIGYELSAIRFFTFRAAVLEWDEASAWAQIWGLASASELPLAWESLWQ